MTAREDYYVYVYIDPRNYEKFYYGKGCGSRKDIHLKDTGKSPKARQIAAIRKAGCEPIVRVIARGLTQDQALLIEATLLWQLGKFTTTWLQAIIPAKFSGSTTRCIAMNPDSISRAAFTFSTWAIMSIGVGTIAELMASCPRAMVHDIATKRRSFRLATLWSCI